MLFLMPNKQCQSTEDTFIYSTLLILTKSARSANAMKIRLVVLWKVKIHYQINILRINATSRLKYTI